MGTEQILKRDRHTGHPDHRLERRAKRRTRILLPLLGLLGIGGAAIALGSQAVNAAPSVASAAPAVGPEPTVLPLETYNALTGQTPPAPIGPNFELPEKLPPLPTSSAVEPGFDWQVPLGK